MYLVYDLAHVSTHCEHSACPILFCLYVSEREREGGGGGGGGFFKLLTLLSSLNPSMVCQYYEQSAATSAVPSHTRAYSPIHVHACTYTCLLFDNLLMNTLKQLKMNKSISSPPPPLPLQKKKEKKKVYSLPLTSFT